jgi:hypothetical protein
MDYEKHFEDLRQEALKEGKQIDKKIEAMQHQALYILIGRDPDMRNYPIESLKHAIRAMEGFLKIAKGSKSIPPEVIAILSTTVETLKGCAMAIWYKEYTIARMVEGIIEDPLQMQTEFLEHKNARKE